jgi:hypothetical protein
MLTFEYEPDNVLEVTLDAEGLQDLLLALSRLRPGDHEHLFTPAWGAYPLTEDFPNPDLTPIHKVTLTLVSDEGEAPAEG